MFRGVSKSLTYNFKTLISFELIYKLLTVFIFSPLFNLSFRLIMNVTGFKYLTYENIKLFASKPVTIVSVLFLLILMMLYTIFEIITIIVITSASRQKVKIDTHNAVKISLKKTLGTIKKTRLGLIFLTLFLIPFLNIGIATSYISVIKIPEYIMDFIKSNYLYLSLYILLMIILIYTLFRWIFAINYMIIDNQSFNKAKKASIKLGKGNYIKDFIKILTTEGLIYLSYIIFVGIGILLIVLINHYVQKIMIVNSLLITIVWLFLAFSLVLFTLLSIPISYASITYLFYKNKEKSGEEIIDLDFSNIEINDKDIKPKKFNIVKLLIIILLISSGTFYTYGISKGKFNLKLNHFRDIEITAHRGASKKYPENTLSAFKGAKKLGATWIELDVQSTKDNVIVVSHDSNFKRTASVNKNVWEMTYEEVSKLDVGSFFSSKYKGEQVPTLEEVIKWASKNNIKLNIELKPTGYEEDFEKNVIDIIEEYDFENKCVITSGNYKSLKNVKKINKNIKTIYVMSIAIGDITKLSDVDGYSIEATNISKSLVNKVHKNNQEIYAWTINSSSSVEKMIDYGVDNIVTDDIKSTKELLETSKTSNIIVDYIKNVQKIF